MSQLQWKALIYQFVCFGILFFGARFLVMQYSHLYGYWIPVTAFVIATILSPKFQAARNREGEKLYMSWIFVKGIKEIK